MAAQLVGVCVVSQLKKMRMFENDVAHIVRLNSLLSLSHCLCFSPSEKHVGRETSL